MSCYCQHLAPMALRQKDDVFKRICELFQAARTTAVFGCNLQSKMSVMHWDLLQCLGQVDLAITGDNWIPHYMRLPQEGKVH